MLEKVVLGVLFCRISPIRPVTVLDASIPSARSVLEVDP
jgi:hypothetical protein